MWKAIVIVGIPVVAIWFLGPILLEWAHIGGYDRCCRYGDDWWLWMHRHSGGGLQTGEIAWRRVFAAMLTVSSAIIYVFSVALYLRRPTVGWAFRLGMLACRAPA